jgi:hypothetical protein
MTFSQRWERFWFEPVSTATLGVYRIAYGLVLLAWTLAISADGLTFFSKSGILPAHPPAGTRWGLLSWVGSDAAVLAVIALLAAAAVCIIAGFKTRLACGVAFVALIALTRRNPFLFNSGDALLRNISLFMLLAPCGTALSLDAWRKGRDAFWRFPKRSPWALRLVQVQISMVYLFTVWAKARGERWIGGTAVAESLRVGDITRFHLPYGLSNSLLIANLMTYGTLVAELSLAIFIWNRRYRPWVIAAGIALHLFIELVFALGFFSIVMITSYIAFVPEDAMEAFLVRVRGRMRRSRFGRARRVAESGDPTPGMGGGLAPTTR